MIGLIFSLDYEIYGTGQGDFASLMIEPTDRLLALFDEFGAKVTIMAEVAEIMALRRVPAFHGRLAAIEDQLKRAVITGHDVQLHLHPAWFKARYDNGQWLLDFKEYALAGLDRSTMKSYLHEGKKYLEEMLRKVQPTYRCIAFRAGNWLMQPSHDIIATLEEAGFLYDTSVFKGGWGDVGTYKLDYRTAYSNIFSWVVDPEDINKRVERQGIVEIPILSQQKFITSMITFRRLLLQARLQRGARLTGPSFRSGNVGSGRNLGKVRPFYSKKFDFCRLSFAELRSFLCYAVKQCQSLTGIVPVVAIGHSTEYFADSALKKFLKYVTVKHSSQVTWATFQKIAQ